MTYQAYGNTDIGKMRRRNEDAFLVDVEHGLFAVADGLGGLAAGNRASRMAIETLRERFAEARQKKTDPDFRQILMEAHRGIRELGREADPALGAGTTLTSALLSENRIRIAHIGDSAAYLFQKDNWKKLTIDHTEAEEFRRLRPGEPVPPIFEHTLTRCLGQSGAIEVDQLAHPLAPGSRLLLCTDGVTRGITPEEISGRILAAESPRQFVEELIDLANERGGSDNATAIAIFIE
jgi:PPM family protein phosphatase